MSGPKTAYVVGAARTAIGRFGGSLKDTGTVELGTVAVEAALERAGIPPEVVDGIVLGNVIHTCVEDMYLARAVGLAAGLAEESTALTLNRLCGSGLEAVAEAYRLISLGEAEMLVAGGVECMSRGPFWVTGSRWGRKLGDGVLTDAVVGSVTCPWEHILMGETAENVAEQHGISREDQDAFAFESQRRAAAAQAAGRFAEEIVPVTVREKGGSRLFVGDEHLRADVTLDSLSALKPAFRVGGTVTAGNSSGMNDAAAAIVVASEDAVTRLGMSPLARLAGFAVAGVAPRIMGMGPVPATRRLLGRLGLSLALLDVIELNEAFAAQALAVVRELDLDEARVNRNGGAIALGHPLGATGAILTVKALSELRRAGGGRALMTACIGGGQGIAGILEAS